MTPLLGSGSVITTSSEDRELARSISASLRCLDTAGGQQSEFRQKTEDSNQPVSLLPLLLQLGLCNVAARDHGVKLSLGGSLGLLGDVRQCGDRLVVYPEPVEGIILLYNV